jgi:YD repeat-containing protein
LDGDPRPSRLPSKNRLACAPTAPAQGQSNAAIWYIDGSAGSAIGQLVGVSRTVANGVARYSATLAHDSRGRLQSEQKYIRGNTALLTTSFGYDAYSRPSTITYPGGEVVTTQYNGMGLPARLISSVHGVLGSGDAAGSDNEALPADAVAYDVIRRIAAMRLGSVWRVNAYAPSRRSTATTGADT